MSSSEKVAQTLQQLEQANEETRVNLRHEQLAIRTGYARVAQATETRPLTAQEMREFRKLTH